MHQTSLGDQIRQLLELIEERVDSCENRRRQALWDADGLVRQDAEKIPITVSPEIQMWGRLLEVSLIDFYQAPAVYVYAQLKSKVFAFDHFHDDRPIDRGIAMWFGTPFDGSLFGIPFQFLADFEPDDKDATLYDSCRQAAEGIEQPDFFNAGMMPIAHRMYEQCRALLPGSYELSFPDYIQTPLSTAAHLVGIDRFLIEACTNQPDARELLKRLIEIRVRFRQERSEFLGIGFGPAVFDNDFVNTPMISPGIYRDLIWPIENELATQEGGTGYWHSCGNTVDMMESIITLPGLEELHVSAWCDRGKSGQILPKDLALQVCVHSLQEVLHATDEQIEVSLTQIIETLGQHRIRIDADCFQAVMDMPEQIRRIAHWADIAQRLTSRRGGSGKEKGGS